MLFIPKTLNNLTMNRLMWSWCGDVHLAWTKLVWLQWYLLYDDIEVLLDNNNNNCCCCCCGTSELSLLLVLLMTFLLCISTWLNWLNCCNSLRWRWPSYFFFWAFSAAFVTLPVAASLKLTDLITCIKYKFENEVFCLSANNF